MSDLNTDPRVLPEPGPSATAQTVLHALTVVQFVLMVFDKEGKPNAQIASFGKTLGGWLAKAAAFQTAQTETKPWPFEG
jgi:uncharacterized membrane protein YsdA (DUF1294 family)